MNSCAGSRTRWCRRKSLSYCSYSSVLQLHRHPQSSLDEYGIKPSYSAFSKTTYDSVRCTNSEHRLLKHRPACWALSKISCDAQSTESHNAAQMRTWKKRRVHNRGNQKQRWRNDQPLVGARFLSHARSPDGDEISSGQMDRWGFHDLNCRSALRL